MIEKKGAPERMGTVNQIQKYFSKKKLTEPTTSHSYKDLSKTDRRFAYIAFKNVEADKAVKKCLSPPKITDKNQKIQKYWKEPFQVDKKISTHYENLQLKCETLNLNKKADKKLHFGYQITAEMPKLRETSSTNCQSPKGNSTIRISKANEFKKIRLLGKGKYGNVYLVRHIYTGFIAALKVIKKIEINTPNTDQNQKAIIQLIRQIKIQLYLDHPNLIKLYDFFSDESNIYLLMELGCDGQLYDLLKKNSKFSEQTTSIIIRQIVEGINFMHQKRVIHRDIKLENVVFAHGMTKICDFGWSVYCSKEFRSTLCGTPLYFSPEILKGNAYNEKVDTWAIGALTHELLTSQNPFQIKSKQDLPKIITEDFQMKVGSPEIRSFVTFILKKNPAKRPDADTLKRHPFIKKYEDIETSQELCNLIYQKIEESSNSY